MIGATPIFSLPPAEQRRQDVAPWAWAYADGGWLDVTLAMNGDSDELQEVAGATAYRVFWLARLVVFTPGIVHEFDEATGLYDWSLSAEEV
jgi:hypothetical protein